MVASFFLLSFFNASKSIISCIAETAPNLILSPFKIYAFFEDAFDFAFLS